MTFQIHLSNLISILGSKFYNLDTTTSITISSLVISILSLIELEFVKSYIYPYSFFLLIFPIYYYYNRKGLFSNSHYKLNVYNTDLLSDVLWYMKEYPHFFDKNYDIEFGNVEYIRVQEWFETPEYVPKDGTKINIQDSLFCITGFINVFVVNYIYSYDKENHPLKRDRIYFEFNISRDKTLANNYITFITKHRKEKTSSITLYGVKYFPIKDEEWPVYISRIELYEGKPVSKEEGYKKYLASYFSPIKNEIWKRVEKIHYNPQSIIDAGQIPNFNILAYGPPGSGKSTFAYRLAMTLNRHLISIDLSTCCDLPLHVVYSLFCQPYYGNRFNSTEPKKCIIILEEFDRAIFTLNQKQKKRDMMFCLPWMNNQKIEKGEKENEKDEEKEEGRIKNFDLGDLLELLQGPIPNSGGIIVATTNHYEKIKEILPALFRPGRLTPIKFDYLNWDSLQELSLFYFQKELTIPKIDCINIPTSKLIDLAMNNDFETFQKELKILSSNNLG